jgi:hypothetical protein
MSVLPIGAEVLPGKINQHSTTERQRAIAAEINKSARAALRKAKASGTDVARDGEQAS